MMNVHLEYIVLSSTLDLEALKTFLNHIGCDMDPEKVEIYDVLLRSLREAVSTVSLCERY